MTMIDTLFGLIPEASRGQQWLADELQLVNWGGYDGAHRIRFSPGATLLCGSSGSGKSTLMDAYIALMMPHTTPFNGASNGGVHGRARGQEQRNILSYSRGKLDESRTAEGTRIRVLRGDGCDTWTAIAMTWVDHDHTRFTALRAWYISASARTIDDTIRVRATVDGLFDLSTLGKPASQHFTESSLRALGLQTFPTDREFTARLQLVLGIGASGAGAKAMNLLARIQAGQQITTVDELYKRMVLEEPSTLLTADAVVEHFDELESTRQRMITARQQIRALEPIGDLKQKIMAAADRLRLIDEVGSVNDPQSLVCLWKAKRRLKLLRDVEADLRQRKHSADQTLAAKQAAARVAEAEQDRLNEVLRAVGGDRLETAQRELRELESRRSQIERNRSRLDQALGSIDQTIRNAAQFHELRTYAQQQLDDPDRKAKTRAAFAEASAQAKQCSVRVDELEAEIHEAEQRNGSIPSTLDHARNRLAEAAGLNPADLPFVGELIEVKPEFEPWREAFNLALGGFATTVLIDAQNLYAFRSAIHSVRLPIRLRYQGVPAEQRFDARFGDRTLGDRLEYRKGPLTGWLQGHIAQHFGYVCADSAAEMSRYRMALSITGLISQGSRGAHGGHGRDNVLGFSNQRRLLDLRQRIDSARARLVEALAGVDTARHELDEMDDRDQVYRTICELTWDEVDTDMLEAERVRWSAVIAELDSDNPAIAELHTQMQQAREKVNYAQQDIGRAEDRLDQIQRSWAEIIDQVDQSQAICDQAENSDRALREEQTQYLDQRFEVPDLSHVRSASSALNRFDTAVDSAMTLLAADQQAAQTVLTEHRESLRRTLESFLERWPNPNLLADPDNSVDDFEHILENLRASGLHELESQWRDSLLRLSGNDLTNLDSTLSRSLREIRDRIEPINKIMEDLPFYHDDHRLQITIHETQSAVRADFRKELRSVRQIIEQASSDGEREAAYERMAKLMNRIRRQAPDFSDLIDVRNHVRISAEQIDAESHEHVALYDHIGEKSGGESQELIAFIVGAALRYQLGDAGAERPRYAPVFLDEALIKADAHFTERAIGAWRGLGFQLIIGAPNDKYSAIEPHVNVEYDILKDTQGRSWAKPKIGLDSV